MPTLSNWPLRLSGSEPSHNFRALLGADTESVQAPPTYEADTMPGFAPYFERAGVDPRYASGHAFELLVGAWLRDVIHSEETTGESSDDQNWLTRSGFRSAVKGGHVKYGPVV